MESLVIRLAPHYQVYNADEERPYCMNYRNSDGELAATRFTYDHAGRNDHAFYQQISGGRSSRSVHEFEADGRIVRKRRTYNDGRTATEVFRYDSAGRLVEELFEDSDGAKGTTRYEYDAAGRAVRMLCEAYKGWLTGVIEFEFDSLGRRTRGRILYEGTPRGSITYTYDRRGNLTLEHWDLGDWNQTFHYIYEPAA